MESRKIIALLAENGCIDHLANDVLCQSAAQYTVRWWALFFPFESVPNECMNTDTTTSSLKEEEISGIIGTENPFIHREYFGHHPIRHRIETKSYFFLILQYRRTWTPRTRGSSCWYQCPDRCHQWHLDLLRDDVRYDYEVNSKSGHLAMGMLVAAECVMLMLWS